MTIKQPSNTSPSTPATGRPGAALYSYVHDSLAHGTDPATLRAHLAEIQRQAEILQQEIKDQEHAKSRRTRRPHAKARMRLIHDKARAFDLLASRSPDLADYFLHQARRDQ